MSDNANHDSQDANEQIAQLRDQVQSLMSDRVAPALSQAADTAQHYASQARDIVGDQSEAALSERIRESPIVAISGRRSRGGIRHRPYRALIVGMSQAGRQGPA